MNRERINKLENPIRISELDPKNTLLKAGFQDGQTLCDIGAGTGIFSFPAAKISNNTIYAIEISDEMIALLSNRAIENKTKNIIVNKINANELPLDNNSCDMALLVTVFHELNDKDAMLKEIKRILKESGKLLLIEFYKKQTPLGPPLEHRIAEEIVEKTFTSNGFKLSNKFSLGDNLYSLILENSN